jgi:predicted transcriptional regulator
MAPKAQENTDLLRKLWTSTAARLITQVRNGEEVGADEVLKLQRTIESIDQRDTYDEAVRLSKPRKVPRARS